MKMDRWSPQKSVIDHREPTALSVIRLFVDSMPGPLNTSVYLLRVQWSRRTSRSLKFRQRHDMSNETMLNTAEVGQIGQFFASVGLHPRSLNIEPKTINGKQPLKSAHAHQKYASVFRTKGKNSTQIHHCHLNIEHGAYIEIFILRLAVRHRGFYIGFHQ